MSKVIVFGLLDTSELAHYYLENDSEHRVECFTVHKEFIGDQKTFKGRPIVPFEDLKSNFSTNNYKMFAPMTGRKMNRLREGIYLEGKEMGYDFISYVSSKATVLNEKIGENCFILEDNTIQPFTEVGNNVVMWSGNHIGHHGIIRDHVFFTSHVVLSGHCDVGSYSWFGVNATITNDCKIAEGTLVAMSATLTKHSKPWTIYMGTPAKERGTSENCDF
jgi:acetyltransferase-like isoleucine patch superfamily enzyme